MRISKEKMDIILAKKGITATECATLAGVSRQTITYVRRAGTCSPLTAGKVAKALGVDVEEIMEEVEQ